VRWLWFIDYGNGVRAEFLMPKALSAAMVLANLKRVEAGLLRGFGCDEVAA
jgi:hypothetical protein